MCDIYECAKTVMAMVHGVGAVSDLDKPRV
jgi:hypothetical protein